MLYLSFYSVHNPQKAPKSLIEKYEAKAKSLSDKELPEFTEEEQIWPNDEKRKVRIRQCKPVYAAMIEAMDTQIRRVLDKLEEL